MAPSSTVEKKTYAAKGWELSLELSKMAESRDKISAAQSDICARGTARSDDGTASVIISERHDAALPNV
jgi:hypothetical protein